LACHYVLVACKLESFLPLFTSNWCDSISFKWWISLHYPTSSLHTHSIHMIQLHPYCHICSCHQLNNLEIFIGKFYSMCCFHLSSKLHQQVCQYVAISSIWFIFIHVTSSLKLFHLMKLTLSNFIDFVRSAPLFRFVFLQCARPTGGAHSQNVRLDLAFISS